MMWRWIWEMCIIEILMICNDEQVNESLLAFFFSFYFNLPIFASNPDPSSSDISMSISDDSNSSGLFELSLLILVFREYLGAGIVGVGSNGGLGIRCCEGKLGINFGILGSPKP